jgi:hypothetical protein
MPRGDSRSRRAAQAAFLVGAVLLGSGPAASAEQASAGTRVFAAGFPRDPAFFPVGVWLQNSRHAALYRAIGINTYVGLWSAPTSEHLAALDAQGLHAVVEHAPGLQALPNAHVIRAWMHTDEPDNAQANGAGGYGDCILPDEVVRRYRQIRAADASRPVFLNFGQGVANPRWFGRGAKCSQIAPADYYVPASGGADIVSFDIYPAAEERQRHVMGKLELVGRGVANLRRWASPDQPVWNAIETTHINNPARRPLPHEVRSEVWMALIHGSTGIFYFVHEWKPSFREDAVFRYRDTVDEIARTNAQIKALAPVLNSPTLPARVRIEAPVEIAVMLKRAGDAHYLFAVNMENKPAKARLTIPGAAGDRALALGEDRLLLVRDGAVEDEFPAYGVRLLKIPDPS